MIVAVIATWSYADALHKPVRHVALIPNVISSDDDTVRWTIPLPQYWKNGVKVVQNVGELLHATGAYRPVSVWLDHDSISIVDKAWLKSLYGQSVIVVGANMKLTDLAEALDIEIRPEWISPTWKPKQHFSAIYKIEIPNKWRRFAAIQDNLYSLQYLVAHLERLRKDVNFAVVTGGEK